MSEKCIRWLVSCEAVEYVFRMCMADSLWLTDLYTHELSVSMFAVRWARLDEFQY